MKHASLFDRPNYQSTRVTVTLSQQNLFQPHSPLYNVTVVDQDKEQHRRKPLPFCAAAAKNKPALNDSKIAVGKKPIGLLGCAISH